MRADVFQEVTARNISRHQSWRLPRKNIGNPQQLNDIGMLQTAPTCNLAIEPLFGPQLISMRADTYYVRCLSSSFGWGFPAKLWRRPMCAKQVSDSDRDRMKMRSDMQVKWFVCVRVRNFIYGFVNIRRTPRTDRKFILWVLMYILCDILSKKPHQ